MNASGLYRNQVTAPISPGLLFTRLVMYIIMKVFRMFLFFYVELDRERL